MQNELNALHVTESEYERVKEWQDEHSKAEHADADTDVRYEWKFIPTCCGIVGSCVCMRCQTAAAVQYSSLEKRRAFMSERNSSFVFRHVCRE